LPGSLFSLIEFWSFFSLIEFILHCFPLLCLYNIFKLVESTFLCNLQDLRNNEAKTSDGVRLVPPGLESLFGIKSQQYSMHVDAIEKEIKLVLVS
jgi:hypothetical protein